MGFVGLGFKLGVGFGVEPPGMYMSRLYMLFQILSGSYDLLACVYILLYVCIHMLIYVFMPLYIYADMYGFCWENTGMAFGLHKDIEDLGLL